MRFTSYVPRFVGCQIEPRLHAHRLASDRIGRTRLRLPVQTVVRPGRLVLDRLAVATLIDIAGLIGGHGLHHRVALVPVRRLIDRALNRAALLTLLGLPDRTHHRVTLFAFGRLLDAANLVVAAVADLGFPYRALDHVALLARRGLGHRPGYRVSAFLHLRFPHGAIGRHLLRAVGGFVVDPKSGDLLLVVDCLVDQSVGLAVTAGHTGRRRGPNLGVGRHSRQKQYRRAARC